MPNYNGRLGAPMIQPTKDELRHWLSETRVALRDERRLRAASDYRLRIATQKLGEMMLDAAIQEDLATVEDLPKPKLLRRV